MGAWRRERHSKLIQRSSEINIPRNHFHRLFRFIANRSAEITRERERETLEQFTKVDRSSGAQFSERRGHDKTNGNNS